MAIARTIAIAIGNATDSSKTSKIAMTAKIPSARFSTPPSPKTRVMPSPNIA